MSKKNLKDLLDSMNQGIKASTGKEDEIVKPNTSEYSVSNPYSVPQTESQPVATDDTMTYDEWLEIEARKRDRSKAAAAMQYNITAQYADQQRQNAYYDAGVAEQKAILDANNAYARNRSTYGAQAESLGRNGLAMSGYSDYGNQVAYATSRAEIAAAGANRGLAERQAEDTYANLLLGAEAQRLQADTDADNTYDSSLQDYIQARAKNESAYATQEATRIAELQDQNYSELAYQLEENPDSYTVEDIDKMIQNNIVSQQQGEYMKQVITQRTAAKEQFIGSIRNMLAGLHNYSDPEKSMSELETYLTGEYNAKNIDKSIYNAGMGEIVLTYARNADDSNFVAIRDKIKEYRESGLITNETYNEALGELGQSVGSVYPNKAVSSTDGKITLMTPEGKKLLLGSLSVKEANAHNGDKSASYPSNFKPIASEKTKNFNEIFGTTPGTVVESNGAVYIRMPDAWFRVDGVKGVKG